MIAACDRCLAKTWLLERLAGHLEQQRREIAALLRLGPEALIAAVAGAERPAVERELAAFDPGAARLASERAGIEAICRCQAGYPAQLRQLAAPPAVLHVAGGLERCLSIAARDPVAVVGSRRPTDYGVEMARSLGRGLAAAGLPVVSGMAHGIDASAHAGALELDGATIAVMPGAPQRPYPVASRWLHRRILAAGASIGELGADATVRRWMFPARNRIVAALAGITVVVEARRRSGALITAREARDVGHLLGAVPGRVTSPLAEGPNALLAGGALVIRGARDVLDALLGPGAARGAVDPRPPLSAAQAAVLESIADGRDTAAALARGGVEAERGLALLAELELSGRIRRGAGGRFTVIP